MPNYDYEKMKRIPVDPKIIAEIQKSSQMRSEQGEGWLAGWGGPSEYRFFASLPMEERLVYAAVLENYSTPAEIEGVTGLASGQVDRGLSGLRKKGLVSEEKVTT